MYSREIVTESMNSDELLARESSAVQHVAGAERIRARHGMAQAWHDHAGGGGQLHLLARFGGRIRIRREQGR